MEWNTLYDLAKEWIIVIIGLVLIGIIFISKTISNKKKKRLAQEATRIKQELQKEILTEEIVPNTIPPLDLSEPFSKFKDKPEVTEKTDIVQGVKQLTGLMSESSTDMDGEMNKEFEQLNKQLKTVNAQKLQLKKYGVELGKLYDKYLQREMHLTQMMIGIERLTKR